MRGPSRLPEDVFTAAACHLPDIPLCPGGLLVSATDRGVCRIEMLREPLRSPPRARVPDTPLLKQAAGELRDYFEGRLRRFRTPIDLAGQGTPFQRRIWEKLLEIPYGDRISYGELARRAGMRGSLSARAAGQANACNPVPILVPCHRVIAAGGGLGGYGGGPAMKKFLLDLESP